MGESKPARKFALIGKTGHGKSSAGNTIFAEQRFKTESSAQSITAKCTTGAGVVCGRRLTVIDTPGIFDTCQEDEDIKTEIIRSIIECAPSVDALVIVLKVERYTRQEIAILDKIVEYCGEDTFKHAVILFTHGEDLEGQTIKEFVQKNPKLQELADKCGGRCHVIDNKHWNDCHLGYRSNKFQVKNLLDTIDKMVEENGPYTNELMLNVEEEIQEEMNSMLIIVNLSAEEKREVAKKIVLKKILIRSVGVATGILIGAFLGIGVAVLSTVLLLKAAKLKEVAKAIGIAVTAAGTVADKVAVAAAAGGATAVGTASVSAVTVAVEAGVAAGAAGGAVGATAAAGVVAVEAGVTAGATGAAAGATAAAAAGTVAVETGVAAGAGIGAAAGSGIAAGVVLGAAALAGAIGGGVTGYKAAKEADSVFDAFKNAVKINYDNAKEVVKKAEELPSNIYKKLQ